MKDFRWAVLFLSFLALWFFWQEVNHLLTPFHLSLYLGGLVITFGALRLPLYPGLLHSCLAAAWLDASAPTYTFGLGILVFALMHLILFSARRHLPQESPGWMVATALVANLLLFIFWSLYHYPQASVPGAYLWRSLADLLLSQISITVIAVWFFSLQNALLNICRMPLEEESSMSP